MSSKPHSVSGVHQAFEVFRLGLAGLAPDSRDGSADQDNIRRAFKKNTLWHDRQRAVYVADRKTQPVPWSGAQ